MESTVQAVPTPKMTLWAGRILTALVVLFLLFDSVLKLLQPDFAVEATTELGYADSVVFPLGVLLLVCLILYVIPQTSVLGAILLTGYLGGAIATQVRMGNPLFSHVLFPIYVALFVWGGLYLRNEQLRKLMPLTR